VQRIAPSLVLLAVTSLFLVYGRFSWSWIAGPVAAVFVWVLELKSREPAPPAPKHAGRQREPAPVD
jgi:hypothetical protein